MRFFTSREPYHTAAAAKETMDRAWAEAPRREAFELVSPAEVAAGSFDMFVYLILDLI